jgi:hypothetical protein
VPTSRWIPSLDDYIDLASVALDTDPEAVRRLPRLSLAESALAAPFAAFGDVEAYPELVDQAAVLITHLVENHPLPDGNKRAGFLCSPAFRGQRAALGYGRRHRRRQLETPACQNKRCCPSRSSRPSSRRFTRERSLVETSRAHSLESPLRRAFCVLGGVLRYAHDQRARLACAAVPAPPVHDAVLEVDDASDGPLVPHA